MALALRREHLIVARVGDTCLTACLDHQLEFLLVGLPVLVEYARRAWHGQHIGIGCHGVAAQRVLLSCGRTVFRVVVLDESDSIALVVLLIDERIAGLIGGRACQRREIVALESVAHAITELKVEGGRRGDAVCVLGVVNPAPDVRAAVPVFTHTECGLGGGIVVGGERSAVAFHHVVAETGIAQVVEQEREVGLHDPVDVLALMVDVTAAVPTFARVVVGGDGHTVLIGPVERAAVVIVTDHIGRKHLVSLAFVGLGWKIDPRAVLSKVVAMVDHHIGYHARTSILESIDHRAQLTFGAEGRTLVEIILGHIAHVVPRTAITRLWDPDERKVGGHVVSLFL